MANPEQPRDDLEDDDERFEDDGRRSIFSALWFRAILVVVVLGVVAAVAVPYVLEVANQPPAKPTVIVKPESLPSTPAPQPPAATAPSTPTPPAAEKPATAEKPAPPPPSATEKPSTTERPATTAKKSDADPSASTKESTGPRAATAPNPPAGTSSGAYFVQVGAFKSHDLAKRLAARLREAKYAVEESSMNSAPAPAAAPAPSAAAPATGSDKYDVYVTGGSAPEINAKLSTRGLSSEPSTGGVVVKPSLTLREAVALSKDLAVDGLKVQVRRAAGAAAASAVAPTRPAPSRDTLYRVRIGPFDDRAAATSALRELEQRGYTPFLARGGQ